MPNTPDADRPGPPDANSQPPCRFVVFDLDGTLVDSRRDLAESANAVLEAHGCRPHPEEVIGRMVGDGAATLVARAFAGARCDQPADALEQFLSVYNSRPLRHTRPYPGIRELLGDLASRMPIAVLTNKPLDATMVILDGLDLARHFGGRIIGDDGRFSRKPDPSALHYLISQSKVVPPETMLVGDSIVDWRTARAAGTRACIARYGFGFEGFPLEELSRVDCAIDHPADLRRCL